MLSAFTVFFTAILLFVVWNRPNDGQTYTVFVGLVTGFSGAILKDLPGGKQPAPPPGTTTVTQVDQVTQTPPDPKAVT